MTKPTNKLLLLGLALLLALGLGEGLLRLLGARPGVYQLSKEFKVVDSLVLYKNFITDEAGIYKFGPWVIDSFPRYLNKETGKLENAEVRQALAEVDKFDEAHIDFSRLVHPMQNPTLLLRIKDRLNHNDGRSDLQQVYDSLVASPSESVWAKAVVNYVRHPFNSDGFRSIAFNADTTDAIKILLIGDSYVYGLNARPFHASFADNLLAKGYMVYTAGIPGTDPAQYAAIAQKYIPVIQPDLVVMCFYEGNDYMLYDRDVVPYRPIEYLTNAGFYQSAPYGKYMPVEDCYAYYKSLITIPTLDESILNQCMAKTSLGSLLWGLLYQWGAVNHPAADASRAAIGKMNQEAQPEFTARHLRRLDSICKSYQVPSLYTIIPTTNREANITYVQADTARAATVFGHLPFHFPNQLIRPHHYGTNDSHFNTAGAKAYSEFLDSCIQFHFNSMQTDKSGN
jgi:hypothetical protein